MFVFFFFISMQDICFVVVVSTTSSSMLFAQPVNTIQNEFTPERCAGRCLQQMLMEDEVGFLTFEVLQWQYTIEDNRDIQNMKYRYLKGVTIYRDNCYIINE